MSGSPTAHVTAGTPYSFQPTASDPNGLSLNFTIQNKPAWAVFNGSTGSLTGTPATANVGTYPNILIGAGDGKATATLPAFSITVQAATQPGPPTSFSATLWTAATFSSHGVRGFNQPGDVSSGSMAEMTALGANVLRFFVHLNLDASGASYTTDAGDLTGLASAVQYGAQFNYKVIVLFYPNTTQNTPEFWANPNLQASIAANWVALATLYRGNTTIAGYDLINEPVAPNGQAQWITLATTLIDGIRRVDPDHVILFEPSPDALPQAFSTMTGPLPFANIVYSLHYYQPYPFCAQGVASTTSLSYPSGAGSPGGLANQSTLSQILDPVRQFVSAYDVPIYVGEFSAARWAPGTSAYQWVSDLIPLFETEGYSWSYHQWRGYGGWDAELTESFFQQFPYVDAMPQGWLNADPTGHRIDTTDTIELLTGYFSSNIH